MEPITHHPDPREEPHPAHPEDKGHLGSLKDELREEAARAQAMEATPVPWLQAGHAHAPARTHDLRRAVAAGPKAPKLSEGRGVTQPVSKRATLRRQKRGSASAKMGSRGGGQRNR
jgi:hypothetical protein